MRTKLLTLPAAVILFATACAPSADMDAVDLVQTYVAEQADATWAVLSGDTSEEALEEVDTLNDEYWTSEEWPDMLEVREWSWNRTQAGETTEVDGSDLAAVASDLEDASGYLTHAIREDDDVPAAENSAAAAVDAAQDYISP